MQLYAEAFFVVVVVDERHPIIMSIGYGKGFESNQNSDWLYKAVVHYHLLCFVDIQYQVGLMPMCQLLSSSSDLGRPVYCCLQIVSVTIVSFTNVMMEASAGGSSVCWPAERHPRQPWGAPVDHSHWPPTQPHSAGPHLTPNLGCVSLNHSSKPVSNLISWPWAITLKPTKSNYSENRTPGCWLLTSTPNMVAK